MTIESYCKYFDLPMPVQEYRFDPKRRWRVDLAWPDRKLAVEVEGGVWTRGRHVRGLGFLEDKEKYNALTLAGWYLLRFTPAEMRNGYGWAKIKEFMEGGGR